MTVDLLGGDSTIRDVQYVAGVLSFTWADFDSDEDYLVQIQTDRVFYNAASSIAALHWRLVNAAELLPVEGQSGRFTAPQDFAQQMRMAREHFTQRGHSEFR